MLTKLVSCSLHVFSKSVLHQVFPPLQHMSVLPLTTVPLCYPKISSNHHSYLCFSSQGIYAGGNYNQTVGATEDVCRHIWPLVQLRISPPPCVLFSSPAYLPEHLAYIPSLLGPLQSPFGDNFASDLKGLKCKIFHCMTFPWEI